MASLINRPGGERWLQFVGHDEKRKTLRLGRIPKKAAESIRTHVEALLEARRLGQPVRRETAAWLESIGEGLGAKLVRCGLVEGKPTVTLGKLTSAFLETHGQRAKPASIVVGRHTIRHLHQCFGPNTNVGALTPEDGERFHRFLIGEGLADSTISKRLAFGRQVLRFGVRMGRLERNVLEGVTHRGGDAAKRRVYVPVETVERALEECPDRYWRLLLALGRFNALRIPSEAISLQWENVDWQRNRLTIASPKTEGRGKPFRVAPLFPMTRPYLEEVWQSAREGEEYVFPLKWRKRAECPNGWVNANLRTQFQRILRRAGIPPWPRPMHALRSSCVSDLAAEFPLATVIKWAGHTADISLKHYIDPTDELFDRATSWRPKSASEKRSIAKRKAKQTASARNRPDVTNRDANH